jgi:acetate kinase
MPDNVNVLVLNCGSTNLKYGLFHGEPGAGVEALAGAVVPLSAAASIDWLVPRLPQPPDLIAHRLVHGSANGGDVAILSETMLEALEADTALAPLHTVHALRLVRLAAAFGRPQAAAFDGGFHATLPPHARRYPLPELPGVVRTGYHGWSHRSAMERYAALAGNPAPSLVTLHLGGGCSATAIRAGRSVDTSMGFTPLEGLMMGTRPGDLDPGILLHLMRAGYTVDQIEELLYRQSGLRGVAGEADMRTLLTRTDPAAALAVEMFCYRARKYVGAYLAALEGAAEALVFTGGIGERSPEIRQRICAGLAWAGIALDAGSNARGEERIGASDSRLGVYALRSNEEALIAREALALVGRSRSQARVA